MTTTVEAIYENGRLLLSQPLPQQEKSRVIVTIETTTPDSDTERAACLKLSEQSLLKAWNNADDEVFN